MNTRALNRGILAMCLVAISTLLLVSNAEAQGEYEPNDSYITATGPLLAGWPYTASLETVNDEDHYYFYLAQQTQLQYQLTNTTPRNTTVCSKIYRQDPTDVDYVSDTTLEVRDGESESGAVTLSRGKYYFVVECPGATGEEYGFTIGPPGVTTTYDTFEAACTAAHPAVVSASTALSKAKRRLNVAKRAHRGPRKIRKLKRQVLVANKAFNEQALFERRACSVPR